LVAAGCGAIESFNPVTRQGLSIANLFVVVLVISAVIFLLVDEQAATIGGKIIVQLQYLTACAGNPSCLAASITGCTTSCCGGM
jgi:hypothetical protein